MFKSTKIRFLSISVTIASLLIGLTALVWNLILYYHVWNHQIFKENHYVDGIIKTLCVFLLSTIIFWICFFFFKKKIENKTYKILSYISYGLYNASAIITIIIVVIISIDLDRGVEDYKLDCQLASDNETKVHEAVDSIIARSTNVDLYNSEDLNEHIMKAARSGYAPAQNYVGVYFHEKAKQINDRNIGPGKWGITDSYFCQEELNRATFWWLKAANQNYGIAQENLGKLKMNILLTNQPYNFKEAEYWLKEATKNDIVSAYYYLGLLWRDRSISEAGRYWQIGAEKGNEDCKKMLENPEFIDSPSSNP